MDPEQYERLRINSLQEVGYTKDEAIHAFREELRDSDGYQEDDYYKEREEEYYDEMESDYYKEMEEDYQREMREKYYREREDAARHLNSTDY